MEVEHGKKAPVGCRKLYLHIQSEDKSYVQTAYKDIKKVIEENAYENMHMSAMGKYTIWLGIYTRYLYDLIRSS